MIVPSFLKRLWIAAPLSGRLFPHSDIVKGKVLITSNLSAFQSQHSYAFVHMFKSFSKVRTTTDNYLGLPLTIVANKKDCFKFIVDRVFENL